MWTPMATVVFPNNDMGLKTYHKLREFRMLHETDYDEKIKMETSMKERKYILMNQRANSIADLAESLRIEIDRAVKDKLPLEEGHIIVRWKNVLDAEYASQWPHLVQHTNLEQRNQLNGDRAHMAPKVGELDEPLVGPAKAKKPRGVWIRPSQKPVVEKN